MSRSSETKPNVSNFKLALGLYGRTIVGGIMGFIVYFSLTSLMLSAFTHTAGYYVYDTTTEPAVRIETHYFEEGEGLDSIPEKTDTRAYQYFRSELSGAQDALLTVVATVLSLILLGAFPYKLLWDRGFADANLVQFDHQESEPLRGLKVGLLANIPAFLLLALFLVSRAVPTMPQSQILQYYRFGNATFYPLFLKWLPVTGPLPAWGIALAALCSLVVPAIATVAYELGVRQIAVGERLLYKKKEKKKK